MVIEKVHGIHATSMSLNDRFTILSKVAPVPMRQKRRASMSSALQQNLNYNNRYLDQMARRLEIQAKRQALRLRLGIQGRGGLRRSGSEGNLSGLRRSNSFSNLSQQSVKSRVSWRQSNGNLSESSFNNWNMSWRARALRGFRRRGGGQRVQRGRIRGQNPRQGVLRMTRAQYQQRLQQRANRARGRGGRAGRGRGGVTRAQSNQQPKKLMSKEELDAQLDQYMAGTKSALDQELETYMKNAMELE